jgi:hypothetical protein
MMPPTISKRGEAVQKTRQKRRGHDIMSPYYDRERAHLDALPLLGFTDESAQRREVIVGHVQVQEMTGVRE